MIFDSIKHCDAYKKLSPAFEKAFAFLQKAETDSLPIGTYEIDGKRVYAMVQEPALRGWEECVWEAHRRYADIQYIISGEERLGFCDVDSLQISEAYDEAKDAMFLTGEGGSAIAKAGDFMVFLPQDAHKPCIRPCPETLTNRKIVVKVLLDD